VYRDNKIILLDDTNLNSNKLRKLARQAPSAKQTLYHDACHVLIIDPSSYLSKFRFTWIISNHDKVSSSYLIHINTKKANNIYRRNNIYDALITDLKIIHEDNIIIYYTSNKLK